MLAPPVVEGEGSGQPTEPQPTPSTTQPIIEEQIPTSVPIPNVADEVVFKEWDDRVVRATITATSLDATQASGNWFRWQTQVPRSHGGVIAQTRSKRASKHSSDSPLPGVNTLGSDEERIEHQELMNNITPTPHDSPLLGGYTLGSDEGRPDLNELMAICIKFSDRAKSSIPPPKRRLYKQVDSSDDSLGEENASKQGRNDSNKTKEFNLSDKGSGGTKVFDDTTAVEKDVNAAKPVSTAGDVGTAASVIPVIDTARPSNVSVVGPSTNTAEDIFEDEMMTIADTLMAVRSTRPRTTLVVIRDVEEEPRRATPVPTVQSQDKEQRIAREKAAEQEAKDAALIAEFDNIQERMEADALLAARLQEE
ncbi:hypothetical protein Tco_0666227 [Tanacetum coccineum]